MARCSNCSKSCECTVVDDGAYVQADFSQSEPFNVVLFPGNREGRRSTVVTGSGTSVNPYRISFIDSEFYQVPAIEYNATPAFEGSNFVSRFDVTALVYSYRPYEALRLDVPIPAGNDLAANDVNITSINNLLVGCSAKCNTQGIAYPAQMRMFFNSADPDLGTNIIGADGTFTADPNFNCTGYVSPLRGFDFYSVGSVGTIAVRIDFWTFVASDPRTPTEVRVWGALL